MSDRTETIALIALQLRIADGTQGTNYPSAEYVQEAIALYRETERQVQEAYTTTSTDLNPMPSHYPRDGV